eukprot:3184773-Pyramimonas_sp.AAC.1
MHIPAANELILRPAISQVAHKARNENHLHKHLEIISRAWNQFILPTSLILSCPNSIPPHGLATLLPSKLAARYKYAHITFVVSTVSIEEMCRLQCTTFLGEHYNCNHQIYIYQ